MSISTMSTSSSGGSPRLSRTTSMESMGSSEYAPLLAEPPSERCQSAKGDGPAISPSDLEGDPDNPLEWAPRFKWGIVVLLISMGFMTTFTCTSVVPIANTIVTDLSGHRPDDSFGAVLPVTIWEVGEAIGPLLIAPLSEMYGRYPLINIANFCFVAATVLSALSPSMPVFVTSRALTGIAVASNVLNPAIIGDIFPPEKRGMAISLVGFSPLLGGTFGPVLGGVIAESYGWRAVLWVSVAVAGACELLFFSYYRETCRLVILRRKAAKMAKDDKTPRVVAEGSGVVLEDPTTGKLASMLRPIKVLLSSGVMMVLSLFSAYVYAYFYVVATTLPAIMEDEYGLSASATGSSFLANGVGSFVSIMICRTWLDKIYIILRESNDGIGRPEYRLPLAIFAAFMMPLALLLYGWSASYTLPIWLMLAATFSIRVCLSMSVIPTMAYVVDACGLYSASAFTGVIVTRCLAGAFLPLSTAKLVKTLGYGWGFTVLAFCSLVFAFIPVLLFRFGARWRSRSKYTMGQG